MKERYPDGNFDDEESYYGMLDDDYNSFEDERTKREDADKRINELFTGNPRFASFFMDTAEGESPVVAFIRHFGKEALELTDDEESIRKITEEDANYRSKVEESKRISDEQQANLEKSQSVFDAFQEEHGLSDDEMSSIIDNLCNRACSIFMGIFQKEDLVAEMNSINHDADVDAAHKEGEAKGRNAKISENKKKKTMPEGMPAVLGGLKSPAKTNPDKTLEQLDRFANKTDIWERG